MRNEKLIKALGNCINHCNFCADACLDEDDVKMMVDCIRIDHVCAEACSALSQILATSYKDVQGLVDYCKYAKNVLRNVINMMHSTVRIVRKHVANVQKLVLLLKLKDLNQVLLKTRPRPGF